MLLFIFSLVFLFPFALELCSSAFREVVITPPRKIADEMQAVGRFSVMLSGCGRRERAADRENDKTVKTDAEKEP